MSADGAVTDGVTNAGTARQIDLGSPLNQNLTVYGATKVNVIDINPACFGFGPDAGAVGSIDEDWFAVPGFELNPSRLT